MSDPLLSTCPACGAETFRKQLTAAGFQLKGSGWYVTDFRGGNTAAAPKPDADGAPAQADVPAAVPAAPTPLAPSSDGAVPKAAPAAPAAPVAAPAAKSPAQGST
jgi:hypothetical protein